ncbi:glutamate racemase [Actinomyces graevenitzii]|uniref:glutamate racemase n=1 Tax=Actinomyces graevenitzii TaxID=55565 RepID=UPI000C80D370|nr:glutamate racemase [Actinomyces graevenitzii]PMC91864.1 glutamate racemase [Actinomyces graevenitzii]
MNDAPIGIFDSGVGGLTVARAILDQLPGERLLYIGDTANSPYGPKPLEQVRSMALNVMDELVDSGVKMLVIACNTATAAALDEARERYTKGMGIPVIEVISPAARTAAALTRSGRVGVIATAGTVNSGAYARALQGIPGLNLTQQACPRFVQLAEAGITTGPQVLDVAKEYLEPLQAAAVDTLVLGCTHYPLLAGPISYVMGRNVALVSSSEETAKDVYRELAARNLLHTDTQAAVGSSDDGGASGSGAASGAGGANAAKRVPGQGGTQGMAGGAASSGAASSGEVASGHEFRATGDPVAFQVLAKRFLGPVVGQVRQAHATGGAGVKNLDREIRE